MLGDSRPPPVFWNTCSYFFWHRNNNKKKKQNIRKTQMPGYLPKRDIKVPPILLVNHHNVFILTCFYQKSYLIFFKVEGRFWGGGGYWGLKLKSIAGSLQRAVACVWLLVN